jgi:DNA-binding transcriptional ArsR family regulator
MSMQSVKEVLEKHTIVIEDPLLRRGFTIVPNLLFIFKGLSHGARLTYVLLLKYAWQEGSCFPGVDRLAEDLGVERKSVMRYTRELRNRGLIHIKRRGFGKTNVYRISRLKNVDILKLKSHP